MPQASEDLIHYVDPLSNAGTILGETRVLGRGGRAGEETDFFNILLEYSGSNKLCMEPAIRINRTTSGLVIRVLGWFTPMRELMRERDHLPHLLF